MTRKHFAAIAAAIAFARNELCAGNTEAQVGIDTAIGQLAATLSRENPRFDRARFLAACRGE